MLTSLGARCRATSALKDRCATDRWRLASKYSLVKISPGPRISEMQDSRHKEKGGRSFESRPSVFLMHYRCDASTGLVLCDSLTNKTLEIADFPIAWILSTERSGTGMNFSLQTARCKSGSSASVPPFDIQSSEEASTEKPRFVGPSVGDSCGYVDVHRRNGLWENHQTNNATLAKARGPPLPYPSSLG
jgi:hypothetical protein